MWVLVSQLHSIHAHGHEETAIEHEHEGHEEDHEEGHEEGHEEDHDHKD
jgi:flagellar biosynthesis/type III secretory pathway protein FliH